jgi:hypothetical protein
MPPPPPQKQGMSTAAIVLIVIVGAVVLLGGGCVTCLCIGARQAAKSVPTASPPPMKSPTPTKPSKPDGEWITAERPYVKFRAPAGWTTEITSDKDWGIFRPPSRDAVFAFTTFHNPGEATVRLSKAASVLGVSDINWGSKRPGTIGKDRFNAQMADGSCNFQGPGGYIWYATVDSGTSDQMLLIFTVKGNAPKSRRAEAEAAIESLQRR